MYIHLRSHHRCSHHRYHRHHLDYMGVDSILYIDCKHENLGANDDLIKTDSKKEKHVK